MPAAAAALLAQLAAGAAGGPPRTLASPSTQPPAAEYHVSSSVCEVGLFELSVDAIAGTVVALPLAAAPAADPAVFATLPGQAFVWAAVAEVGYVQSSGFFNFEMEDGDNSGWGFKKVSVATAVQVVTEARCGAGEFELSGTLRLTNGSAPRWTAAWRSAPQSDNTLDMDAEVSMDRVTPPWVTDTEKWVRGNATVVFTAWKASAADGAYGFGEQYNYLNFSGLAVPVWSREAGLARGLQPLTKIVNAGSKSHLGGEWYTTYGALAYYSTLGGKAAWLRDSQGYVLFDLRRPDAAVVAQMPVTAVRASFAACSGLLQCVQEYTAFSGRAQPLPEWSQRGAVVGTEYGEQTIDEQLAKLEAAGCPIAAVWHQDWAGIRPVADRRAVWWDWVHDEGIYPNWRDWSAKLNSRGIQLMVYFNPMLLQRANVTPDYYSEAVSRGLVIKGPDGEPVKVYGATLLDLTNPAAVEFFGGIVRDQALAYGVKGWMADFGEAVPPGARLHDGRDGWQVHNYYPDMWFAANRKAVGGSSEYVFFGRSLGPRSVASLSLMWSGDQLTSWDGFTGMGAALGSLLASGLSGVSLQHSDIGGYKSFQEDGFGYARTEELFNRWCEMAAFTALYRTHPGSNPEVDAHFYTSNATLKQFTRFAKVFASLYPYRATFMAEAAATGRPLVRPLAAHYADDPVAAAVRDQFLLGTDLLVAPVLEPNATHREVYFPSGLWQDFWDAAALPIAGPGQRLRPAPLGRPPVFHVLDAPWAQAMRAELRQRGVF
eukprot:TRINITY_DN7366_c0_g1_i1.p1 TRINITY_DN7366_c0_g1~~TRINITY_DN7366_c0_g1_i1.p1  ORF type:complete len:769 (+),score=190.75 TRINITY_DN7366_c0_g1_i1:69-2375(+)